MDQQHVRILQPWPSNKHIYHLSLQEGHGGWNHCTEQLFGLNSHLLGCDDKCWGVSKSCVSKTACSTHRTSYSIVFNAENQLSLFTNCFSKSIWKCKCLSIYHFLHVAFHSERNWMLKDLDYFLTQNAHSLCKPSITHTYREILWTPKYQISNYKHVIMLHDAAVSQAVPLWKYLCNWDLKGTNSNQY